MRKEIQIRLILKEEPINFGKILILGRTQPQVTISNLRCYDGCLNHERIDEKGLNEPQGPRPISS